MSRSVKLIVLCGLPASGKSTTRTELERILTSRKEKYTVVCPDDIRKELTGDTSDQTRNADVFELAYKRLRQNLRAGKSVVFDATNVDKKNRRKLIKVGKSSKSGIIALWQDTNKSVCIQRNNNRERVVPEFVIQNMCRKFQKPDIKEGFDSVIRVTPSTILKNVL